MPHDLTSIGDIEGANDFLKDVKWLRAGDIAKKIGKEPVLFKDGPTRFDINQGELGDCWFLATLANLPAHPKLFKRVVPSNQTFEINPGWYLIVLTTDLLFTHDFLFSGIFHFKFWQYGEWIDVVIDDYLPCLNDKVAFLQSDHPEEFWTPLVEKAYAKLYGNYSFALNGGLIGSSMEDLSGGVAESYHDFQNEPPPFKVMLRAYEKGSMMGAAIWAVGNTRENIDEFGLADGHAYSVTKVVEFEAKGEVHQLVRIRNPWGNETEWKGAWSDQSENWKIVSDEEQKKLGLIKEDNGEFFMAYNDFLKVFIQLI